MLVKTLLNKEVIGSNGDKIGKIDNIEIDILQAKVKQVIIKTGLATKYKIKPDDIITVGEKVIIRLSSEDLKISSQKKK